MGAVHAGITGTSQAQPGEPEQPGESEPDEDDTIDPSKSNVDGVLEGVSKKLFNDDQARAFFGLPPSPIPIEPPDPAAPGFGVSVNKSIPPKAEVKSPFHQDEKTPFHDETKTETETPAETQSPFHVSGSPFESTETKP